MVQKHDVHNVQARLEYQLLMQMRDAAWKKTRYALQIYTCKHIHMSQINQHDHIAHCTFSLPHLHLALYTCPWQ